MNETKLIPNIRFKGFKNNWKIEHLKDIGAFKSGIAFPKNEQGGFKGTPFYKVSDLGDNLESKLSTANNYVTNKQIENNKWKVIDSSFNGAIVFAKIGAAIFLNRKRTIKNKFLMDNNLMAYIISDRVDCAFIVDYLQKINFSRFAQVGALPSIDKKDLERIGIYIPTNTFEQQKIGALFAKLDRLLDLQQQKLDQLELLKKALLQKLFPKQDAKIPELRFNGFEGEWKKDTIGDLIKSVGYKNFLADVSSLGEYPVIQQGEEPVLGYSSKKPFQKYNDVVLFGDHTLSLYKPKSPFLIATDGIKIVFVKNWNGQFLYAFLQKYKPHSEGYKRHFTILKSKVGKYPLDIKEQQKIGNLLAKVDRLIELENKKFSNLKLVKKSLLQNMFVE